mgnify:FL=1
MHDLRTLIEVVQVSIRSRLFGREKRHNAACSSCGGMFQSAPGFSAGRNRRSRGAGKPHCHVSIRSRLFGREKPSRAASVSSCSSCFNPLPAFRPGETPIRFGLGLFLASFQSAPGFSAGRNVNTRIAPSAMLSFQSAPGFSAGRNEIQRVAQFGAQMFQSAPGFSAGRNGLHSSLGQPLRGFNPLPAFRPGETVDLRRSGDRERVSIRSRLFGREKRLSGRESSSRYQFQSAPGFSAGRNDLLGSDDFPDGQFQSAPGFSAGRNEGDW